MNRKRLSLALVMLVGLGGTMQADEGMWLFNQPPRELLKARHGFELTDAWLDHVRLASVRFNNGGSGSFVGPDGLVITNHHVGSDALQKLSPKNADYYKDGFHAKSREVEPKCPDLELNVLQSIEDVTDRVNASVPADLPSDRAAAARKAVLSAIEKESLDKTGLRSDVVTLYQGGLYHLYRYKKYTDVRLVFAPEHAIASFGGDVDNFEFPRHNLDICFFRVYEDGKPARISHYLKWHAQGPREGDLVFVSGHPGTTNRQETFERLKHRRDVTLPYLLQYLRATEARLSQFSDRGTAERKMARGDVYRVANARKAITGQHQGLLDPSVLKRKQQEEAGMLERIGSDEPKSRQYQEALDRIAKCQQALTGFEREHFLLEIGHGFECQLFKIARHLVRLAAERPLPSSERLREYRDSNLESLELELFSPAPIHEALERFKLAGALSFLAEGLGGGHPFVVKILAGKSPADRAAEVVSGTKLFDPEERRKLAHGGAAAISASSDAMIQLARLADAEARALRKRLETEIEEVERQAYAQIAKIRFEKLGASVAPDATFTLRLAFGVVKGYEVEGRQLPFATSIGSLIARNLEMKNREPFELPERFLNNKDRLDPRTPFNFVSTADTIGGNSGSPVLNRAGEFVGINFDRNRHGLVRNFVYSDVQARHISVHSAVILELLRKLYGAEELVRELTVPA